VVVIPGAYALHGGVENAEHLLSGVRPARPITNTAADAPDDADRWAANYAWRPQWREGYVSGSRCSSGTHSFTSMTSSSSDESAMQLPAQDLAAQERLPLRSWH